MHFYVYFIEPDVNVDDLVVSKVTYSLVKNKQHTRRVAGMD